MLSELKEHVLVLHPDLGGGEHYPGMCHRWVGATPFPGVFKMMHLGRLEGGGGGSQ